MQLHLKHSFHFKLHAINLLTENYYITRFFKCLVFIEKLRI